VRYENNLVGPKTSVKVVDASGQISLGKEYAGRQVLIEEREPGVWLVRTAIVMPENEAWMHAAPTRQDLREALAWAQANPRQESNPGTLFRELGRLGKAVEENPELPVQFIQDTLLAVEEAKAGPLGEYQLTS
jgi:hypothetical protein